MRPLQVRYLGRMPYAEAWDLQRALMEQRKADAIPDTLLMLEHEKVITVGRDGSTAHVLHSEARLAEQGVELFHSDRGGDATYHGPGQVVAYPIMDLRPDCKDVRKYVRRLEQAMIDTLADYGVVGARFEGEPGCWMEDPWRKIGAVGARFSRWVTMHGFALNVNTDLRDFGLIVPCGIPDKGVTSLQKELGQRLSIAEVMETAAGHLARLFERALERP